MNRTDLAEAVAALRAALDAVAAAPIDRTTQLAGRLAQARGSLRALAADAILGATAGSQIAAIFTLLRQAGASFAAVDAIRQQALARVVASSVAGVIVDTVVLVALATQCRIVADTSFASRNEVDSVRSALDLGFDASLDKASNAADAATVRALVSLRASVMRDLAVRARPLPKLINYAFPRRRPALTLAQRLYGDGARYAELIAENTPVHPLFMPPAGRALSR